MDGETFKFPFDVADNDIGMLFSHYLQSIEKTYQVNISIHDRMGLLLNIAGHFILPDRAVHMNPYCLYRRFEEKGWSHRCVVHCKYHVNRMMRTEEKSMLFNCWKGVQELVVPLFKNNKHIMSIYAGAFRGELPLDHDLPPDLLEMHRQLPLMTPEYRFELERVLYMLGSGIVYVTEQSKSSTPPTSHGRKGLIEQCIERNAHKPDFSLNDLAIKLNLSSTRTSHLVKELFHETFKRLLNRTRMNRARQMLVNTDLSIKEISDRLGFVNVYYFSKTFKRFEGSPPGKCRKDNSSFRENGSMEKPCEKH